MKITNELSTVFDLILNNKAFFVQIKDEELNLISNQSIHENSGLYIISGCVNLSKGGQLTACFVLNSDANFSHDSIYFKEKNKWYSLNSEEALDALNKTKEEIFPISWIYHQVIPKDAFKA